MSFYSVILFLHIVGALTLFMTFALEWISLRQMQRATARDQARTWVKVSLGIRPLSIGAMLVVILAGGYLAKRMEAWHQHWVWVALAATFAIAGIAVVLTQRRMKEIQKDCGDGKGELMEALARRLRDPILLVSLLLRAAIALEIVFLMTTKPNLGGALLTLGVAAIAGILPALLTRGGHRPVGASAEEY